MQADSSRFLANPSEFADARMLTARGVRAPLGQPLLHVGASGWYLRPGYLNAGRSGLDSALFDVAFEHVFQERFDDTFVRSNGMQGRLVRLAEVCHPRPWRIEYGDCYASRPSTALLASYPACTCPSHLWSKRHMPVPVKHLLAHVLLHLGHLPPFASCRGLPNSVTVHWYPNTNTPGNGRGNTRVGWHTDSYSANNARVAQRPGTPVISISFGETMQFCLRHRGDGREAQLDLEHGSVWVWPSEDDKSGWEHSVCYDCMPPPESQHYRRGRWVIIARWLDTVREYQQEYPHRNVSGGQCWWLEDES